MDITLTNDNKSPVNFMPELITNTPHIIQPQLIFTLTKSKRSKTFKISENLFKKIKNYYNKAKKSSEIIFSDTPKKLQNELKNELDILDPNEFWGQSAIILDSRFEEKPKKIKSKKQPKISKKQLKKQKRQREKRRRMRLKTITPKFIPYKNIDINIPTKENECMKQYIEKHFNGNRYLPPFYTIFDLPTIKPDFRYEGETINDLINFCTEYNINYEIYDINNKIIDNNTFNKSKTLKIMCYNEHAYGLNKGHKFKLNNKVVVNEEINIENWAHSKLNNNYIYDKIYIYKDDELQSIITEKTTINPDTEKLLRKGIKPYFYNDLTKDAYSYDLNKAYYTVAKDIKKVFYPKSDSMFIEGKPKYILDECFYIVENPPYYFPTNMVQGKTLKLFKKLKITHYLHTEIIDFPDISVYEDNPDKFREQNGIWGKLVKTNQFEIEMEKSEANRIIDDYKDKPIYDKYDKTIKFNEEILYMIRNNRYLYYAVVAECFYRITKQILEIKKQYDIMPVSILTDSISYTQKIPIPKGYKLEKVPVNETKNYKIKAYNKTYQSEQIIIDPIYPIYNNKSILGPPGTAKTRRLIQEYKYDLCCTSEKALASNIPNMTTIHSLFCLNHTSNTPNFKNVINKIVWVDEISKIPDFIWNVLMIAYKYYNTRFIFTGDFNQFSPICDDIDIKSTNFLGDIIELNDEEHQERSSSTIIEWGNRVLNGDISFIKKNPKLCKINICFTNKMRHIVNEYIANQYKKKWGDKGIRVMCLISSGKFIKNKVYDYDGSWKLGEIGKKFDWGYCFTSYSRQGFTYSEDIGVFEWEYMMEVNKTHLWNTIRRCKNEKQLHFF